MRNRDKKLIIRSDMEELEIVSPVTGEPLGLFVPRAQVIGHGYWCRSTNVYVLNSAGQVLCHQRSKQKERMPGFWCTHLGGHVSRGETFESNAQKELAEEAGLLVPQSALIPWRTTRLEKAHLWVREFVLITNQDVSALTPQQGEVDAFAWKYPQDIDHEHRISAVPWCAGTHDFRTEYHCLMAVLTAAYACGVISDTVLVPCPIAFA